MKLVVLALVVGLAASVLGQEIKKARLEVRNQINSCSRIDAIKFCRHVVDDV